MKVDLHIHSTYSGDSKSTVKQIIKRAQARGIDGIGIMDHNTLKGYEKAKRYKTNLIIVPGVEVSAPEGHILALGLQEEIDRQPSIRAALDEIRSRGAIAVAAHPYRFWSGIGEENTLKHDLDAVEGLNGRGWRFRNIQAQKLAQKMDLPITGGSDSHQPKTVGKSYTIMGEVGSWEDVIREIKKKRTKVGGEHRTFIQTLFYVRKALSGWVGRGFKKI